jgi:hypothetical protein
MLTNMGGALMNALVVPGVRVEARFDVLPPLPAGSGVVGIAAIVDRPPNPIRMIGVTKAAELAGALGPGTATSAPEIVHALANGAAEVVISPVAGGGTAAVTLNNGAGDAALTLRARSNGTWANALAADIRATLNGANEVVRVTLRLLRAGRVVEEFPDLSVTPGDPNDLFQTVNTRSAYVVAVDPGFAGARPAPGNYALPADGSGIDVPREGDAAVLFTLFPDPGQDPAGVVVEIANATGARSNVTIRRNGMVEESFSRLTMDPDDANELPAMLLSSSRFVHVIESRSRAGVAAFPAGTAGPQLLAGGTSPNVAAYRAAIDRLAEDSRINLVVAAIEPGRSEADVSAIHQALQAHAVAQADQGSPRIAFGSVTATEEPVLDLIRTHAAAVRNRRFVLVSPPGAAGAVAGLLARIRPEESPTFKNVPLFGIPPASYSGSQLNRLLGPTHNLLVVQEWQGRGVVVLRGLDTSGDQISVTRVADAAIRETKAISENFIGQLNTNDARAALKAQIVATLTRMERAGALVPSTDGSDPAFLVDVYSTQLDFAQGIVRIDIAVRPVRAIDFIYATIRVKN